MDFLQVLCWWHPSLRRFNSFLIKRYFCLRHHTSLMLWFGYFRSRVWLGVIYWFAYLWLLVRRAWLLIPLESFRKAYVSWLTVCIRASRLHSFQTNTNLLVCLWLNCCWYRNSSGLCNLTYFELFNLLVAVTVTLKIFVTLGVHHF